MANLEFIAIDVGHTRTAVALVCEGNVQEPSIVESASLATIMPAIASAMAQASGGDAPPVIVASVNEALGGDVCAALRDQVGDGVYVVGDDLPVPLVQDLAPEAVPGVDRLLGALAAWHTMQSACIVVDAGTAVTVDFVDGEGTYHGGAIAPGLRMSLEAMSRGTSTLPDLQPMSPDEAEPFGRSTADAMQLGAHAGIRGMVRHLAERYATAYDAWPPIVATGGDAEALFRGDELIDRIVPDLVLRGIAVAAQRVLTPGDATS
ncbi:MAG: type III pantothenate kinase [Phycisphaerales bacterium]|nr:type III pantothenate kinase [Phycisphaerales bacterium]